jgi:hypothetical protein
LHPVANLTGVQSWLVCLNRLPGSDKWSFQALKANIGIDTLHVGVVGRLAGTVEVQGYVVAISLSKIAGQVGKHVR